jgi:hypothetical protein
VRLVISDAHAGLTKAANKGLNSRRSGWPGGASTTMFWRARSGPDREIGLNPVRSQRAGCARRDDLACWGRWRRPVTVGSAAELVAMVRCQPVGEVGTVMDHTGGVDVSVHLVAVALDVDEVDGVAESRGLEQVVSAGPQHRHLGQFGPAGFELAAPDSSELSRNTTRSAAMGQPGSAFPCTRQAAPYERDGESRNHGEGLSQHTGRARVVIRLSHLLR